MKRLVSLALCMGLIGCATDVPRDENEEDRSFWENIAWQFEHFVEPDGHVVPALAETSIDVVFASGRLTGHGGCNRYFGNYRISDDAGLKLDGPVGSTMMACSDAINEQERRYFDRLAKTNAYRLDNDGQILALTDSAGKTLMVFKVKSSSTLEQTNWRATGINNGKGGIVSDKYTDLANAYFASGTVQGKAGCNRYSASYTKQDKSLRIDSARTTRMFCAEEGVMALETNFLNAMGRVVRYEIDGDRLKLLDADGALLIAFIRHNGR